LFGRNSWVEMKKILSVSKQELQRRIEAEKQAKVVQGSQD
jgi:hypothetical protein